jgi:hypothetical protein
MAFVGGVLAIPSSLWATGSVTPPQWQTLRQVVRGYTCEARYRIDRRAIRRFRSGMASIDWFKITKPGFDGFDDFDFMPDSRLALSAYPNHGPEGIELLELGNGVPSLMFDGYKVFFQ